jgi:hypothetical protein
MYREPLGRAADWLSGIPVWAWAVTVRWSTLIGGGVMSTAVYLWDRTHDPAHVFSLTNLFLIMGAAFIASGYDAWHAECLVRTNERRARIRAEDALQEALRNNPEPLIRGEVLRFDVLDAKELSDDDFKELEQEFGRPGMWYAVRLRLENLGVSSSTNDWHFLVRRKDGALIEGTPTAKEWSLKSWPKIEYLTFAQVQNTYIDKGRLYNICIHVVIDALATTLDMSSFEVRLRDMNGREVVCVIPS